MKQNPVGFKVPSVTFEMEATTLRFPFSGTLSLLILLFHDKRRCEFSLCLMQKRTDSFGLSMATDVPGEAYDLDNVPVPSWECQILQKPE